MRHSSTGARGSPFGLLLRQWRAARRQSQLALATEAGISARHLGFIEIGRACPSRDMVLLLAATLDVPLHERNILLVAAGYAPMYRTSEIVPADQLARIRPALEYILEKHEPFPALVTDRHWNLLISNRSCRRVFGLFLDFRPLNTVSACFDPAGLRPFIANWEILASAHVQQLHREILASPPSEEAGALLDELLSFPGVPAAWRRLDTTANIPSLLPLDLRKGDLRATFLSSFTSFSMPHEATQQGVRIECMFPADPTTDAFVRGLAAKG
jgi:transcriptional regulator with XRE-family HTH domain